MDLNPEKIILDIESGLIPSEDIQKVLKVLNSVDTNMLARSPSVDDIYSLVIVLAKLGDKSNRFALERLLDSEDPLTVSKVLEVLCLEWKLVDEYIERVIPFAIGMSWDIEHDVKESAFRALGEFLFAKSDNPNSKDMKERVQELLFQALEDDSLEDWTRIAAAKAILRVDSLSEDELPGNLDCLVLARNRANNV